MSAAAAVLKKSPQQKGSGVSYDAKEFAARTQSTWVDSNTVKACHKCNRTFSMTLRKHHCRDCGNVFCGTCSNYQLVINGHLKRACLECYTNVVQQHNGSIGFGFMNADMSRVVGDANSSRRQSVDMPAPSPTSEVAAPTTSAHTGPNGWVELLLVVRSKGKSAPSIEAQFPPTHEAIEPTQLEALRLLSLPTDIAASEATCDMNFMFCLPYIDNNNDQRVLNCYVSFSQSLQSANKQALVLISRLAYPQLAFRVLSKLEIGLYHVLSSEEAAEDRPSVGTADVTQALQVAYQQFHAWPQITPNKEVSLPFFGEVLQYKFLLPPSVPADPQRIEGVGVGAVAAHAGLNLVSMFAPFGLLPHMWSLWELLVTGQDIVVLGPSPDVCSEMVIALASIVHTPLNGHRGGDVRPYIADGDPSLKQVVINTRAKYERIVRDQQVPDLSFKSSSSIIGITDIRLLKHLGYVSAVLVIGRPTPNPAALERYSARSAALTRYFSSTRVPASAKFTSTYYLEQVAEWRVQHSVAQLTQCLLLCRVEPSSGPPAHVIKRLRKLNQRDFIVLGDRILRDHFNDMTAAFLKPVDTRPVSTAVAPAQTEATPKASTPKPEYKGELVVGNFSEFARYFFGDIPLVIFWSLLVFIAAVYLYMRLPPILLLSCLYLVKSPDRAPEWFESLLQDLLPEKLLYPVNNERRRTTDKQPIKSSLLQHSSNSSTASPASSTQRKDFSGVWKRTRTENFEAFAGAQGAGFVQRKLAASMSMTHTLTMNPPDLSVLRLQEKGGPIDTDTTYDIGGDSVTIKAGPREFVDTVKWDDTAGTLVMTRLHVPEKDFEVVVTRFLEDNGTSIRMTSLHRDLTTKKETLATSYFTKEGPSPNAPPKSSSPVSASPAADTSPPLLSRQESDASVGVTGNSNIKTDLSGVWERVRTANFESYIGAQGANFEQRKLAAQIPLTHTITMNPPELNLFRLQEKGGPLQSDWTYSIGSDFVPSKISTRNFRDRVTWNDGTLVIQRVHEAMDFELVHSRRLEEGEGGKVQLVMTSVYRDLITKQETVATLWFDKIRSSPNKAPTEPSPLLVVAPPPPVPVSSPRPSSDADERAESEDSSSPSDFSPPAAHTKEAAFKRVLSTSVRVDFSGVWKRMTAKNVESFIGAQGGGFVQRKLAASMALQHTITMDPPFFTGVRIHEKGAGPIDFDNSYHIDGSAVESQVLKRTFVDKCYWEGEALVVQRMHTHRDFELILKRYMESNSTMRLVSIHRNLKTGEETESISFFNKVGPSPFALGEIFPAESHAMVSPSKRKAVSFGPASTIPDIMDDQTSETA